ncbi:hypothetical protein [Sporosarcina psychrophila]|uniref:hypothetical protein n=1 Tax=Sporosarcina psychrophila TaxID=1476 RepID=UPI00078E2C21|nr:hypothetical protein [Sporosarcina psychrophila]AMQ05910.1 hypothetical protein AZE41_08260 [Sporosarcina psychrophila]
MTEYKQIHFKVPQSVFEVYEAEADENGFPSVTAQIKAEIIKQAKIKRMILQIEKPKTHKQPNFLDVFEGIE